MITTSRDVLETLGTDKQPANVLVALGYSSREKGQLEQEILDNAADGPGGSEYFV